MPSLLTFYTLPVIRLFYSLITQKVNVGQSFRKGKIVSESHENMSLQGHGIVLNHPVYYRGESTDQLLKNINNQYRKINLDSTLNKYLHIVHSTFTFNIAMSLQRFSMS